MNHLMFLQEQDENKKLKWEKEHKTELSQLEKLYIERDEVLSVIESIEAMDQDTSEETLENYFNICRQIEGIEKEIGYVPVF